MHLDTKTLFTTDPYQEDVSRLVLLKSGRYRVTHSLRSNAYALWYGGSILKIANRGEVVSLFRERVEEMQQYQRN